MSTSPPSISLAARPSVFWTTTAFAYIYVAWGASYLAIHEALESLPPFLLAGVRFFLAGTILLTLFRFFRSRDFQWGSAGEWKDAGIVGGLLVVSGNGMVAWAQQVVPSGMAALLFGTMPLWIIFFDWMRPGGVVPSWRTFGGLVLGLVGVAVLVNPGAVGSASPRVFWGEIALLAAACSWAAGGLYSRHAPARGSLLLPMGRQLIVGGGVLLLFSVVHGDWNHFSFGRVSITSWLALVYLVVCGSLAGFTTYVWLMRVSDPEKVATISYINILVAFLLGWWVLREPLNLRAGVGAAITLSSVVLVLRKPKSINELIDE